MAISASSYGVGNRVYNGGSTAPTRGTVDPMGYIDRELNAPSQSRSGLASAALRRMSSGTSAPAPTPYGEPTQDGQTAGANVSMGGASLGMSPTGKLTAPIRTPQPTAPTRFTQAVQPQQGQYPTTMRSPFTPGSVNGTGGAPGTAAAGGTAMPFDPETADAIERLYSQDSRFNSDLRAGKTSLEQQYARMLRDVEDQRPDDLRDLRESFAGRGLAYSSRYAYDNSELNNDYARRIGDMQEDRTRGMGELDRQGMMWGTERDTMLAQLQRAAARKAAQDAANLELGVTPLPTPPPGGLGAPPAPGAPLPPQNDPSNPNPPALPGGNQSPFRRPGARTNQRPAPAPGGAAPGVAAPGAPPKGQRGMMVIGGQQVSVNEKGIIDSQGPFYGKYPAQVMGLA